MRGERSDEAIPMMDETRSMRLLFRRVALLVVIGSIGLALAGCGKKGNPQPPPDEPNTYPRVYPNA